jgi:hypothetical protein
LAWDAAAVAILGVMVASRSFGRWAICVVGGAVAVSVAVLGLGADVGVYRGLSGVDSALFVTAAVLLLQQGWREGRQMLVGVSLLALAGFTAKTLIEVSTGEVFFVQDLGDGVTPVALAHLAGGVWGLVAALCPLSFRDVLHHTSRLLRGHLGESATFRGDRRLRRNQTYEARCADDREHIAGGARGAHSGQEVG